MEIEGEWRVELKIKVFGRKNSNSVLPNYFKCKRTHFMSELYCCYMCSNYWREEEKHQQVIPNFWTVLYTVYTVHHVVETEMNVSQSALTGCWRHSPLIKAKRLLVLISEKEEAACSSSSRELACLLEWHMPIHYWGNRERRGGGDRFCRALVAVPTFGKTDDRSGSGEQTS